MEQSSKFNRKTLLWIAVGIIIFALGVFSMLTGSAINQPSGDPAALAAQSAPLVDVIKPKAASRDYIIRVPGRFRSRQTVSLVGEVVGKVVFLNDKLVLGGRLDQDELLLKINPLDFEAEVARATAGVASAEALLLQAQLDNDRQKELAATGAASQAARDAAVATLANAEATFNQAKAQLLVAEQNLVRTEVRSPFPAIVLSENVSIDSYVSPGQQLAELMDARAGELVAGLSPKASAAVAALFHDDPAQTITATARPNDGSVGSVVLQGYVENFSPSIDQASRSALVVAVFPDAFSEANVGRVFSDDFMTLEIMARATGNVWQVPYGAVRRDRYLWVIDQANKLQRVDIDVVRGDDEKAFVTSDTDLSEMDIVATLLAEEAEGLLVRSQHSGNAARLAVN